MTTPIPATARVLVIEDDPSVGRMIQRTLVRAGPEVTLAASGAAGRNEVSASPFELLIMDKNLPDMDGIRLLKDLRQAHPEMPAIVITADPTAPTRLASRALGAFAYLSKPFEIGALLSLCVGALTSPAPTVVSPSVLVVDDDDSVGKLSLQVLKRDGFEVVLAPTMAAALADLERRHFDLLLVDRCLVGGDGVELARVARKRLPRLGVILMTAGETPSPELRSEMDGYLPKPFHNLRALIDEIRRVMKVKATGGGQPHD